MRCCFCPSFPRRRRAYIYYEPDSPRSVGSSPRPHRPSARVADIDTPIVLRENFDCFFPRELSRLLKSDNFFRQSSSMSGSYGKVFLWTDTRHPNKKYAIKVIAGPFVSGSIRAKTAEREIQAFRDIHSPFIVKGHGFCQTAKAIYIVMDWAPGPELFDYIREKNNHRLDPDEAKNISAQVVLAMQKFHNSGYIYRDLKPENIKIDQGVITIVDLGGTKQLSRGSLPSLDHPTLSRGTTIVGTAQYLSPEVISLTRASLRGDAVTDSLSHGKEVDFWTFGILLYEMLTGKTPFASLIPNFDQFSLDQQCKALQRLLTTNPVVSFPPSIPIPEEAKDLIRKLLVVNPRDRLTDWGTIKREPFFRDINFHRIENDCRRYRHHGH